MVKGTWVVTLLFSAFWSLLLLTQPNLVSAEQILVKGGGEYLGWKVGATFKTCHGSIISIGNGVVRKTSERCPGGTPPPAGKPGLR